MALSITHWFFLGSVMIGVVAGAIMIMAKMTDEKVCNDRCNQLDEPEDKLIIKLFSEEGLDDEEINTNNSSSGNSRWRSW